MAEEFPAAIYGGSWWMSPRTTCNYSSCSSDIADMENLGPFWPKDLMDKKSKSSHESSDGSLAFQDIQKPTGRTTTMLPDSAFQMIATVFSDLAATTDLNQNSLPRVQDQGINTFSATVDDGLKVEIEADHHQVITLDHQQRSLNFATSSNGYTTFPISSTSYGYPSNLVQSFYSCNSPPQQQPQPLYDFQLINNTPFLSASTSHFDDNNLSFFPSYKEKESFPNLTIEHNHQEIPDFGSSAKKGPHELLFKRPRLETPSPLPTFKVRKEKLGDRITALQQLVSPFGKTDTASVLHEAIKYIKLLHDQLNMLSAPYMKGATKQIQPVHDKVQDEGHKQDLRSLGLCLVPVSSMFPIASEMTTGFWTTS